MTPNQGIQAPRMGIQRSLIAPGVTPQARPPGPSLAESLMQFLGTAAQTAGAAAQAAAVHEQLQEMDDTEKYLTSVAKGEEIPDFKTVRVHNAVWENQAHQTLDTLDPATLERMPGEDETGVLHRWLNNHTPAGAPDVYKAALLQGARGKFAAHTIQETRLAQTTARNDVASNVTRAWATLDTGRARAAFATWLALAKAMHLTVAETLLPLLNAAQIVIQNGWTDRAEQIEAFLGEQGHPELALAAGIVEKTRNVHETNIYNAKKPEYAADIQAGKPRELVRKEIHALGLSHDRTETLDNYILGVSRELFEQEFFSDFLSGTADSAGLKQRAAQAQRDGILEGSRAVALMNAVHEGNEHMALKARIIAKYANPDKMLPLTAQDDDAALGVMLDMRAIEGFARNPNGTNIQYVMAGDRTLWADFLRRIDRLPQKISDQMASNVAHPKEAPVALEGLTDYLYLSAQAPHLADAALSDFGDLGRLRVRTMSRLLTEAGVNIANPAAASIALQSAMPSIMAVQPVQYTRDQVQALIFQGDITADMAGWNAVGTAQTMLEEALPRAFRDQPGWLTRERRVESPSGHMANVFLETMTDEFKALVGAGWPEAVAKEKARQFATNETLSKMRPITWRKGMKQVLFVQGGPTTTPDTGANIYRSLLPAVGTPKEAEKVAETYRPVWSEENRGYILVSEIEPYGEPYRYMRDGKPVLFVSHGTIKAAVQAKPEAVLDWSRLGQQRMAQEILDRIALGESPYGVLSDTKYEGPWEEDIYEELKKKLPASKE